MLGLWAFAWASIHILIYVLLDLGGYWPQLADDLSKRPYIMLGALVWLLLLPLAATSTNSAMRKLGRRWKQLHRLVYLAAPLAIAHEIWQEKNRLGRRHLACTLVGRTTRCTTVRATVSGAKLRDPLQKSRNR
jgi:sulfoxide reductase heme-binding subunit YedZ